MNRVALWILAQIIFLISAQAVPPVLNYAGQVTVNGEAFDGNGLFKFALVNTDGTTTYWSNDGTSVDGSEPQASVAIPVSGGLYAVLLGNTAQQGMGAIDPALFVQHSDAKLRVWFSDGVNGFQQLSPDRPFASVPYAFSAGTAQTAGFAPIANGAVNLDMLSEDLKTQINAPISRSRLTQEVVADINATIGLDRLSSEIISKLEQNATITNGSVTGSKMADGAITTDKLNEQILKYLKPEITSQPQAQTVYADTNASISVTAEGKYLTYQWKKDGADLTGETNATLNITDANATLHDGNYSVVVSNDFGNVQSDLFEFLIVSEINEISGLIGWWKFDETSGTVAYDSSGNERDGNLTNGPSWNTGKIGGSLSFDGNDDVLDLPITSFPLGNSASINFWAYGGSNLPKSNSIIKSVNLETSQPLLNIHLSWQSTYKVYWDIGNVLYRNRLEKLSSPADIKGRWVMWTFQKDSSNNTMKIFTDANLFALGGGKSIQTSSLEDVDYLKVGIGYHGLIDDLRIYDRALSAEEVQALYNLGQ